MVGRWAVYRNGRARWGGEPDVLVGRVVSVSPCGLQFTVADSASSGRVWTRDLLSLHRWRWLTRLTAASHAAGVPRGVSKFLGG